MIHQKIIAIAALTFCFSTYAQPTYMAVGAAKTKQAVVAFTAANAASAMASSYGGQIHKTIESDIKFYDLFKVMPVESFPQGIVTNAESVKYPDWLKAGTDFLTYSQLTLEPGNKIDFNFHVVSISGSKEIFSRRYAADSADLKTLGHAVADDLVKAITGKQGLFRTRIAFVCDKSGKKEIYTMAFDGGETKQVTNFRSISMAPAWSPDGSKIAFSILNRHSDNTKNIDLYELSFKTGKVQMLSNRKGMNSGADYHPNGRQLALTMSHTGNPEIFIMDIASRRATQLTKSLGFDVDPRFSPDGSKIAFTSSRAGKPMIYVMPTDNPNSAKRLTYAGQYNATPSWLPDSKKLVFAGWLDNHFDLFLMNLANDQIERLTKSEGNNEDPSVSPDGNFIVFSSNRANGTNIWVMSTDARFAKRLTFGMGNCVAPQWSPYLD